MKKRPGLPRILIFAALVTGSGFVGLPPVQHDTIAMTGKAGAAGAIRLKARYYQRLTSADAEALREKNSHHAELDWSIPLDQVALVCLDIWNTDVHQDMRERDDRITREKISPLVTAARAAGLQIIHAPSPSIARRHPNWVNLERDEPSSANAGSSADWPPPAFVRRAGEFAQYASPEEAYRQRLSSVFRDILGFHELVRPVADEPVVATGEELHRVCAQKGILFLLFVGFHTPGCMITRTYGMTEMRDRGYTCILVRDCTNGMETHETFDEQISMNGTIAFLEHNRIYTILSTQVMSALVEAHSK